MASIKELSKDLSTLGVELIAGDTGNNQTADYITILELPEKTKRFKEKGLVLSTFQSFKDVNQILKHMEWLKGVGITGIGFHTAYFKSVPVELLSYANEMGFPLFYIPVDVPYHKIFDIFNELENRNIDHKAYEVYMLNEKLMESIFAEKDVGYIISLVGNYIKDNIILLDSYLKVTAIWTKRTQTQEDINLTVKTIISEYKENLLHSRFSKRETKLVIEHAQGQLSRLVIIPIFSKEKFFGYIIVSQGTLKNFYSKEIIKSALRAISLTTNTKGFISDHYKMRDMKHFEDILTGDFNDITYKDFHISIDRLRYCAIVDLSSLDEIQHAFHSLAELFMSNDSDSIAWIYEQKLVGYLESDEDFQKLKTALTGYSDRRIGLSAANHRPSIEQLHTMYEQAVISLEYCQKEVLNCVSWKDMGIEKIANYIKSHKIFKDLDNELLNPLLEYDRQKNSVLTDTLDSCLKHFFNLKQTSEELYVHPNTVKYRLAQITEILDMDIHDPSQYSLLVTAFAIRNNRKENY